MNSILKYLIISGLFLLLLTPFIVSNTMFFPYIVGKAFFFRIVTEILLSMYIVLAVADKSFRPKASSLLYSVCAFTGIMLLADIFAEAPYKALWGNFERMDGFINIVHLFFLFIVFFAVMKTENLRLWFLRASVFLSLIMTGLAISEWLSSDAGRVQTTLGNPIYVGVYFLFNFFFALYLLYKDVILGHLEQRDYLKKVMRDWKGWVYGISALLFAFGIYRTATRGVILGLLGGIVIMTLIIAIFEKRNKFLRGKAIAGLVLVFIIIGAFFALQNTSFVKNSPTLNRFTNLSWTSVAGQGQARQYVWPMAIKGFVERPVLGWGQEGFNYVFNKYYDARMYAQEQWFDRAHNMPLDVLVAGGALGFLSYIAIFISALCLLWKKRSKFDVTERAIFTGLLAGYFFQNLFVFDNIASYFFFFVILALIQSQATEEIESENKFYKGNVGENVQTVVSFIVVVLCILSVWYFNMRPMNANTTLIQAIGAQKEGLTKNLELFKKAIAYNTIGLEETREQLVSIAQRVAVLEGVSDAFKIEFINLAFTEMNKQIEKTPNDARYQYFLGSMLTNTGNHELALPYILKAKELSPAKQAFKISLSNVYINLGMREKSLEEMKDAYESEPNYSDARIVYIASAIINKKEDLALSLLGTATTSDGRVSQAYVLLATEYLQKNDKWGAVQQVEKAIKINPSFESEGRNIIDAIWSDNVQLKSI